MGEALQEESHEEVEVQCVKMSPLRKVQQCFEGFEERALQTGVRYASEALRCGKRALF